MQHELEVHQIELEQQNEELRASRADQEAALARYTEIFDFAPIGYAVVSNDFVIQEINLVGARLLRGERARIVRSRLDVRIAAGDRKGLGTLVASALCDEGHASCDLTLADASVILYVTATRLPRAERSILLAFQDVTEERARSRRLAESEAMLQANARRKDDFLSALSHELRNPLATIRNSLFAVSQTTASPELVRASYAIIDRQTDHLSRLVDDLLDVTRITHGKMQIRRESVDVGQLVANAVDDHRPTCTARGIALATTIEPRLVANVDPVRIAQVIGNLLNNAEKFTPSGGHITIGVHRQAKSVVIRVRDDGSGIHPDVLPFLFEPFTQGPQTVDRSRGGLGLGLATVKGIVELHDGTIEIASAGSGRGTEVVVRLPVEPSPHWTQPAGEAVAAAAAQRVLVIDDNVDGADSLTAALRLLGHTVTTAYSGTEGLRVAHEFHPTTVVCDIGLPDMDGYAVASAFRDDDELRGCYLIALSGYARPADVEHANRAGFDRHLAKPTSMRQLAEVVAHSAATNGRSPRG